MCVRYFSPCKGKFPMSCSFPFINAREYNWLYVRKIKQKKFTPVKVGKIKQQQKSTLPVTNFLLNVHQIDGSDSVQEIFSPQVCFSKFSEYQLYLLITLDVIPFCSKTPLNNSKFGQKQITTACTTLTSRGQVMSSFDLIGYNESLCQQQSSTVSFRCYSSTQKSVSCCCLYQQICRAERKKR